MSSNKNMNHKGTAPQQRYNTNAQFNPNAQGKSEKLLNMYPTRRRMNVKRAKKILRHSYRNYYIYAHTHTHGVCRTLACQSRRRCLRKVFSNFTTHFGAKIRKVCRSQTPWCHAETPFHRAKTAIPRTERIPVWRRKVYTFPTITSTNTHIYANFLSVETLSFSQKIVVAASAVWCGEIHARTSHGKNIWMDGLFWTLHNHHHHRTHSRRAMTFLYGWLIWY